MFKYIVQDVRTDEKLTIIRTPCLVSAGDVVIWKRTYTVSDGNQGFSEVAAVVKSVFHVHGTEASVIRVQTTALDHNPAYVLETAGLLEKRET